MEILLENNALAVTISTHGAEITSIKDKCRDREYVQRLSPASSASGHCEVTFI